MFLNLESCGANSVVGDPGAAASLVNSMALELAASVFSDAPTVPMVEIASPPDTPNHRRMVDVDEALGWMRDRNDSATALLAYCRLTSLFALQARSRPQDSHEPVIMIVDPTMAESGERRAESRLAEMIETANGDLGTVLVAAGPCPSSTWRLESRLRSACRGCRWTASEYRAKSFA